MNITENNKSEGRDWLRIMFRGLVQTLFPVSLVTFLLLLLLETIFKGSVSSYINIDQLLILVVIIGVIAVMYTPNESGSGISSLNRRHYISLFCFGIGGGAVMWYKTQYMGWFSVVISIVSGALIVLLLLILWQKEEGEELD